MIFGLHPELWHDSIFCLLFLMGQRVRDQYEQFPYPAWDGGQLDEVSLFYRRRFGRFGIKASGSLLDIGCGTGLSAAAFSRLGFDVQGIDFSSASIDYARKRFAQLGLKGSFMSADLFSFEPSRRFELVSCLGVLHHTQAPLDGLARIGDWVTGEGHLLLFLYHPYSVRHNLIDLIVRRGTLEEKKKRLERLGIPVNPNTVDTYAHELINYVSLGKVKSLLRKIGFHDIRYFYLTIPELISFWMDSYFLVAKKEAS